MRLILTSLRFGFRFFVDTSIAQIRANIPLRFTRLFWLMGCWVSVFSFSHAQTPGTLYGLGVKGTTINALATIDTNGTASFLQPSIGLPGIDELGSPRAIRNQTNVLDADQGEYMFIVSGNGSQADALVRADLNGNRKNAVTITLPAGFSGTINSMVYDCVQKQLLVTINGRHLATLNRNTGSVQLLNATEWPIEAVQPGSVAINPVDQLLYFVSTSQQRVSITIVDTKTGRITQTIPLTADNQRMNNLVYHCGTRSLYAVNTGINSSIILRIDPLTGAIDNLFAISKLNMVSSTSKAMDEKNGIYYFVGGESSNNFLLYSVDVVAGRQKRNPVPLVVNEKIAQLSAVNYCMADAGFSVVERSCSGDSTLFKANKTDRGFAFQWSTTAAGVTGASNTPQYGFTQPLEGSYVVKLVASTCFDTDTITQTFTAYPIPDTLIKPEYTLCAGDTVTITLLPQAVAATYTLNGKPVSGPALVLTEGGAYEIGIQIGGCMAFFTTNIVEKECPCRPEVPNAFTPNSDGRNDTFSPVFDLPACDFKKYELRIFNRWGKLVYQSDSPSKPWNGEVNSKPGAADVYVWTFQYEHFNRETKKLETPALQKGSLTLLR